MHTFARSLIRLSESSSFTSAMIIGVRDKSLSAFLPISFRVDSSFSLLRPAMPHDRPSSNFTASNTVYFPAANTKMQNWIIADWLLRSSIYIYIYIYEWTYWNQMHQKLPHPIDQKTFFTFNCYWQSFRMIKSVKNIEKQTSDMKPKITRYTKEEKNSQSLRESFIIR